MTRWLLASLWLCMACGSALPNCPKEGGPPWVELRADHFILVSDLSPDDAREVLRTIENVRAALFDAIAPSKADMNTGRIPVVVLRHADTFEVFFSRKLAGVFLHNVLFRPMIVMRREDAWHPTNIDKIIKHELTHYLSGFVLPHQSRWLAEGLATYFQTIEVDIDKGTYVLGKPPFRPGGRIPMLSIADVVDGRIESQDRLYYNAAWATVHYLLNRDVDRFVRYQHLLIDGASHEQAWSAAFPALSTAELERNVRRYLVDGKYQMATRPYHPREIHAVERALSDSEVHTLRALLYSVGRSFVAADFEGDARPVSLAEVQRELDEAGREDPTNPEALALRLRLSGGKTQGLAADAEAAVRAHPDSWLAWLVYASTVGADNRALLSDALRRSLALAADDPAITIPDSLKKLAGEGRE